MRKEAGVIGLWGWLPADSRFRAGMVVWVSVVTVASLAVAPELAAGTTAAPADDATSSPKPTLVSVNPNGSVSRAYNKPVAISADGRFVLFNSQSRRLLVRGHAAANVSIESYVRDTKTGRTEFLNLSASGGITRSRFRFQGVTYIGASQGTSISADGRYVLFYSTAKDLVRSARTRGPAGGGAYFVRDRKRKRTYPLPGVEYPTMNPDGRVIAYWHPRDRTHIFLRDRVSGRSRRLALERADGRPYTFRNDSLDRFTADGRQVILHESGSYIDLATGLVKTPTVPNGASVFDYRPDTNATLFVTTAQLVAADINHEDDCYLTTAADPTPVLLSADATGKARGAFTCRLSNDQSFAVVGSRNPLLPADSGREVDLYVRWLSTGALVWIRARRPHDKYVTATLSADDSTLLVSSFPDFQIRNATVLTQRVPPGSAASLGPRPGEV